MYERVRESYDRIASVPGGTGRRGWPTSAVGRVTSLTTWLAIPATDGELARAAVCYATVHLCQRT
jgi:hypothetical protein